MGFPNTLQGSYATPYETGSTRLYPLGQRLECPNGRTYRYAEMGSTAGEIAKLYQSEVNANFDSLDVESAISIGDTEATFTNGATALALNELAGGYVCTEETDDLGETHRIRANTITAASTTGTIYLFPDDSFQVAVAVAAGTNVITLVKSPHKGIIIHPARPTGMVVGIPQVVIAANEFGWVQTHGVASCVVDGTVVIGQQLRPSEDDDGGVALLDFDEATQADAGMVGWCMEVVPDLDFGHIFLTLEGL